MIILRLLRCRNHEPHISHGKERHGEDDNESRRYGIGVCLLVKDHAVFAVADTLRDTSRQAVDELKALGVATVMSGIALWLAVLHQLTGALLLAATSWGAHELGRQSA